MVQPIEKNRQIVVIGASAIENGSTEKKYCSCGSGLLSFNVQLNPVVL